MEPSSVVDEDITTTRTVTRPVFSPAEQEVVDKAQELSLKAIESALDLLENGSPQQKNTIIRAVLPSAIRKFGGGSQVTEQQSVRMQLDDLFTEIRSVTPVEHVVTPTDIIDVKPETLTLPTQDQNEVPATPTFGH